MPRYIYRCDICDEFFKIDHSITEKLTTCEHCGGDTLVRLPSVPLRVSMNKQKAGQMVKDFIEDAKKEIISHKKEMINEHDS
jgi:putative FmdB family regulatory protein